MTKYIKINEKVYCVTFEEETVEVERELARGWLPNETVESEAFAERCTEMVNEAVDLVQFAQGGSAEKFLAKSVVVASECKSEHYYVCESMQRHNEECTQDFSVPKLLLSCDWNWALGCDAGQPDLKGYTALGLKVQDNKCEVTDKFFLHPHTLFLHPHIIF